MPKLEFIRHLLDVWGPYTKDFKAVVVGEEGVIYEKVLIEHQ